MADKYEEKSKSKKTASYGYFTRSFIISSSVIAILIWGSAFLILAISKFLTINLQVKEAKLLELSVANTPKTLNEELNLIPYEKRLGFNQTRNSTFTPKFKSIQWISEPNSWVDDKGLFSIYDNDTYAIKSINDDDFEEILYNSSKFLYDDIEYEIDSFVSSPNLKYALVQTNRSQHWRHSSFGIFWVLDVENQVFTKIHDKKLALGKWAPTSTDIAYVLENNVWIYDIINKSHVQASFDGNENLFNGKPDWVYEEEVLEGDTALWWSPDGTYLSFLKTNDTLVREFPIPYFIQNEEEELAYPELRKIKYPKPGYDNPIVKLALFEINSSKTTVIDYTYDIFTEILWVGNDELLLKAINREADLLEVVLINAAQSTHKTVRYETTDSWFEISHDTLYIPKSDVLNEEGYIDTISLNGYNHLAYFSPPSNSTPKILTSGDWEVVSAPSSFDRSKNLIYYFSTQDSSIERHLYSVSLLTADIEKITEGEGWFSASFSAGSRYVSLNYRGPNIPYQKLLDLYTLEERSLVDNEELESLLDDYFIPKKEYGELDIGTATVNYVERFPPNFDPSKTYPVLFFVYGGPGSQLVTKTFSLSFPEVVSAQLDAVVVTVDGRGTGFKGRNFRSIVRDNLGYYEVIDQIAAAKFWRNKSYVDEENIALFGWSYGGYMTLKTLEKDAGETFSYGLSVAPVTDWRLYDSVYTERYMHSPQNNLAGYEKSAVSNVTQIAKSKRFLLCHGTGDDNVHFQNSAKFLDKLDLAGIENYDVHVFPDSDHSISYHGANVVIYDKLLAWLRKAFHGQYLL
ncbi:hypothetical protein WICMUC_003923 [Wickerhamomyces mucosus]|uniref:Dipeptidyl aminopeptidase B n=1 Tax=Wickerhamomyces mucosus TaxID=1378264 RepID=A0A9P8PKB2_9ASCO|nr:hypothetical protein WICMUC_003923 [Wickerhamomyces mucosus]